MINLAWDNYGRFTKDDTGGKLGQNEKRLKGRKKYVKRLTNENNGRDSRNERKTYFETPSKYNQ